jgi:single-strand DNA-binding protein
MGRLTADTELRRTNSGKAVVSFNIACDKPGKDNGASFIPCVAWEKTGEFIHNYFGKGSAILLEGRLESRQYETKDGQKRTVVEVVVSQAHFCERKKEENDGFSKGEPPYQQNNFTVLDNDEPLPF